MTLNLDHGDTGEAILPVPVSAIAARFITHNHDLDPSCVETRNMHGRPVGACLKVNDKGVGVPRSDRDGSEAGGSRSEAEASRGDNPSTDVPTARAAVPALSDRERLDVLDTLTEGDMRAMLAYLSGYAPEAFDRAVSRQ